MQTLPLIVPGNEPLPAFGQVRSDLRALLPIVYEALETGSASCRRFYEEFCDGDEPESHLREMIVRDQARRFLRRQGLRVKVLKELPHMQLVAEPLISLLVHCDGYALRVLKGRRGIPPGCGMSKKRREYYNQAPVRFFDQEGSRSASHTNLLLLWDFDPLFGIAGVWLACPARAGSRSQDVVLAWKELIEAPVRTQRVDEDFSFESGRAAEEELEALLVEDEVEVESSPDLDLLSALDETEEEPGVEAVAEVTNER